ncbi:hypothetical protein COL13_13225 [Bacillus cereus]|nr:hypothetical protein COL13_13225 [Bacillus cereus]
MRGAKLLYRIARCLVNKARLLYCLVTTLSVCNQGAIVQKIHLSLYKNSQLWIQTHVTNFLKRIV